MIEHMCWRCLKKVVAAADYNFCPECGAPYQQRHKVKFELLREKNDETIEPVPLRGSV